jgi:hypothetical protein
MKALQIVVALLLLTFSSSATFAQQTTTLEPGKAIDKTIGADETHSYTLTLASGMYGLLRVWSVAGRSERHEPGGLSSFC